LSAIGIGLGREMTSGYVAHHDQNVVVVDKGDHYLIEWAGLTGWEREDTQARVVDRLARRGLYGAALSMMKYGEDE
jgi:hypothetical protein